MKSGVSGRILYALMLDRRVRVLVAVMTGPADEVRRRHGLGPSAAVLAAEGLVAAALLSSQLKGEERHTVNLYGEDPKFELLADLWADGRLRARFQPADLPPVERFQGLLAVLKFLGSHELYRGMAEVQDERIGGALQRYFQTSVQISNRVRIQAEVDDAGRVVFAAGLLIEPLPGVDLGELHASLDPAMEQDFRSLVVGVAAEQLAGQPLELLEAVDYSYDCPCSRDRVLGMLRTLGPDELMTMLEEDQGAEVTCNFCNERYRMDAAELGALIHERSGGEA